MKRYVNSSSFAVSSSLNMSFSVSISSKSSFETYENMYNAPI